MKSLKMKASAAVAIALILCLTVLGSALGEAYTDMDTVMAVQEALNAEGYSSGLADGYIGNKTVIAITSYQQEHELEETGTITDELLTALDLEEFIVEPEPEETEEESEAEETEESEAEDEEAPAEDSQITNGKNMLLNSLNPSYTLYREATATITRDVAVEEWDTEEGIQVQGTGGAHQIVFILRNNPNTNLPVGEYTASVYVKNNGATPIEVGRDTYDTVAPGEAKRIVVTYNVTSNPYNLQIQFKIDEVGEAFDFTFWHPMVERGNEASEWTAEPDIEVRLANIEARLAMLENQ